MGENTAIEWADHTFNMWRGCTKIAPGCKYCYAETLSKRNPETLGVWGDDGSRAEAAPAYWRLPLRWARAARAATCPTRPRRPRVFCASLADVWEKRAELHDLRLRLFALVLLTPELDWLLLTKRIRHCELPVPADYARINEHANDLLHWPRSAKRRPQPVAVVPTQEHGMVPNPFAGGWPPNVWVGVSVATQGDAAVNLPLLRAVPARVRFVSYEPAIELVDFAPWLSWLSWVVMGGESGAVAKARPANVQWFSHTVAACARAGVPAFVKQMGTNPYFNPLRIPDTPGDVGLPAVVRLKAKKGQDPAEWPKHLRVQEHPKSAAS